MKTFLRSNTWAKKYESCYPQGNGTIGVMDNLSPIKSVIWLNDESMWSGKFKAENTENIEENILEHTNRKDLINEIRKALDELDLNKAEKLVKEEIAGKECESYIPIGKITIDKGWGIPTKYTRELDIDRSVLCAKYILNEREYHEESFVSNPENIYVKRISCNKSAIFRVRILTDHRVKYNFENNTLYAFGRAPSHIVYAGIPSLRPIIYDDLNKSIVFGIGIKIDTDAEYVYYSNDGFRLANATYLNLYYTSLTSYSLAYEKEFRAKISGEAVLDTLENSKTLKEIIEKTLNNAFLKTYIGCLNSHIKDYKKIFDRMTLEINNVLESPSNLVKSLKEFNKGGADLDSLIVTLYNYNRYLLISSSRENSLLPANLQGIWSKGKRPRWSSGYTLNINLQMNYWGALNSNLYECTRPLIEFVKHIALSGEITAREKFGCKGFVLGHNSDAWFHSSPVGGETKNNSSSYSLSIATSGWLVNQLYDIYKYTLNEKYLRDDVLPLMEKALIFYLEYLYLDKDGKYCTGPDISPENSYLLKSEKHSIDKAPTITLSVVRELMRNYIECVIPGEGIYDKVKSELDKIQGYRITSDGRIAEWSADYEETEITHRHLSPLYGIYPGSDLLKDENLVRAANKTLIYRGDAGTGWSLAWKICMYARMKDGETAFKLLKKQFAPVRGKYGQKGGSYLSLLSAHPPFQIDGNFGTLAGINEMLVQSLGEKIELLPAIPSAWKNGQVKGMRTRGNKIVNFAWKEGRIISSEILDFD